MKQPTSQNKPSKNLMTSGRPNVMWHYMSRHCHYFIKKSTLSLTFFYSRDTDLFCSYFHHIVEVLITLLWWDNYCILDKTKLLIFLNSKSKWSTYAESDFSCCISCDKAFIQSKLLTVTLLFFYQIHTTNLNFTVDLYIFAKGESWFRVVGLWFPWEPKSS